MEIDRLVLRKRGFERKDVDVFSLFGSETMFTSNHSIQRKRLFFFVESSSFLHADPCVRSSSRKGRNNAKKRSRQPIPCLIVSLLVSFRYEMGSRRTKPLMGWDACIFFVPSYCKLSFPRALMLPSIRFLCFTCTVPSRPLFLQISNLCSWIDPRMSSKNTRTMDA